MNARTVGLSLCCTPDPDRALFDAFARAGVGAAEISLDGRRYRSFPWRECGRWARDAGVALWSVHLPFWTDETVDPASPDPALRRRTAEIHAEYLRLAAGIGIRRAVVHACLEPVPLEPAERARRLAFSRESMAALADVGAREGVVVCVEDLPRSCLGNTSAELSAILEADPRLRVCFDTNHLLGESIASFLAALGPKIETLHVSDYDFGDERHWLPGEGAVDWPAFMDGLDAIGYRGPLLYEVPFAGRPESVDRGRALTPEDFVRNARQLEARAPLTVVGRGGAKNLPAWRPS